MIGEIVSKRYFARCEKCGWKSYSTPSRNAAKWDEEHHVCGEHREVSAIDNYRGILGGFNRDCICGGHYVSETAAEPFSCPRAGHTSVISGSGDGDG